MSKKKAAGEAPPKAAAPKARHQPPAVPAAPPAVVDVLTNRYDNYRAGANMAEGRLDTSNVAVKSFGKLFTRTVDGDLYAQPLIACGILVGGRPRNVVFLATSRNWVYAYDADDPEACLPLWSRNLGTPVPRDDIHYNYLNFANHIGITSTPVIELDGQGGGTMYLVYKTRTFSPEDGSKVFTYYLRALDILTGEDRPGPGNPSKIDAKAATSAGKLIRFDTRLHLNRPGLLLSRGVIYMAFSSHADWDEFYGWVMAYDCRTLKQLATYNTAPDWGQAGIWQSGTGLAADAEGFVYVVVANGEDPKKNAGKPEPILPPEEILEPVYGNAILKMKLAQDAGKSALVVEDWFTAFDTMTLNGTDDDFIGGPVLFDVPPVKGSSGRLVIGGGKDGKIYLGDRNNLGRWAKDNAGILQADPLCAFHIHGAPVIWKSPKGQVFAYVWSEKDFLKCLHFNGKVFDKKPQSKSVYGFPEDELRMPGGILAVSANGDEEGSAIVWASHPTDDDGMNQTVLGTLRAYDARNLNRELWTSDMDAEGNDRVGSFAKFCPPVVANGKVYLATFSRELVVFGLFSEIGKQTRNQDCGIFRLQAITFEGAKVWQSGNYTCNHYDLTITGAGIGGLLDSFLFAFVKRDSLTEPAISITARVDGMNAPDFDNPYAGVMIRKFEGGYSNSINFASVVVSKESKVLFLYRDSENDPKFTQDGPIAVTFPCFIRLRAATIPTEPGSIEFVAEYSQDGAGWKTLSAVTKIKMDGELMVGLVASAQLGKAEGDPTVHNHAKFSMVAVGPAISKVDAAPPMETDLIPPGVAS